MTTSKLSRVGQEINKNQLTQSDIKSNTAEATRLYQRGVAAARGGQRRIAAGLLTRSVQLDPNNEGAWLWLSGVLEDPHQIAFCLQSVLKLNPASERARKGLRWLEEKQLLTGTPEPTPLLEVKVGETPANIQTRTQGEQWWVNWRQVQREMSRVNVLVWSVPLILLLLALLIHQTFVLTLSKSDPPPVVPTPATVSMASAMPTPEQEQPAVPTPTPVPVLEQNPIDIRESRTIAYLNTLQPIRQELRDAVELYRRATGKPGSAAIAHTAAAQNLRSVVEGARTTLQAMNPPMELRDAHAEYIQGLTVEIEAIDAMMEFYSSYQTEYANRAAVHFQEANNHFARAQAGFDARLHQIQASSAVSVHTLR